MRSGIRTGLYTALLTAMCATTASAQMRTYYHVGSWDAFSGTGTNNKVCGVGSTNPVDNRSLSMRFEIGGDTVTFQVKKQSWTIPTNTPIALTMQIGGDAPWNLSAVGNGQTVEWTLDPNGMQAFDQQFRAGSTMTLTFPAGNERPWTIGLNGSTAISNAFGRCVTDLSRQAGIQNSLAPPPPAATEPYGQAPSQPFVPAQAAPTAPAAPASGTTQP